MTNYSALFLMLIVAAASCLLGISGKRFCDSPQYLEYGKSGTIRCSFHEYFFGVLWYNTTDYATHDPLVDYLSFIKTGTGYTSGKVDVDLNGSLIINHVSLEHERTFLVVYLHSEEELPLYIDIKVLVVVKPSVPFPVFDQCGNISNFCYAAFSEPSLQCSVPFSRPAIPLHIVARTVTGDINISDNATITPDGVGYTSRVITKDLFMFSTLLALITCKASILPGILENNESFLLAQNIHISLSSKDVTVRYIELSSRMELSCAATDTGFIVWKKAFSLQDINPEVLLFYVNIGKQYTKILAHDVTLGDNTSLIISNTKVKNSGYFYCLYGDGRKDVTKIYEVVVFVFPFPAYPVIGGCNHQEYCVLEAEHEGNLTCTVKGIRPLVQLQWLTFHNDDAPAISLYNQQLTISENGETFDVTLTSTYVLKDNSRDRVTIECKVQSPKEVPFHFKTRIDLLFVKDSTKPLDVPTEGRSLTWIIPAFTILLLWVSPAFGVIIWRRVCKERKSRTGEEELEEMTPIFFPNNPDGERFPGLKDHFLNQIKEKYADQYNAVQPIPYIKDRMYCVDRVYIEGGIECLDPGGAGTAYENLFTDPRVQSKRRILEGEPGYGKSTVTLQFAYDWCNSVPTSPLKDVEILILLRLRQLGGVTSIYEAIKRFLLPKDSLLTEVDVKHILIKSKSVVIILDGFDEYPDQDDSESDVIRIIAKLIFSEYEVVLTTRSSCLPNNYPASTKRVRLTGFDDNARRYYIRKAVVSDDGEVRKIEGYLEKNPILNDLCQVPLIFVIFAHMTYESEQFRKLDSVTSFFRYMISCFHSHMKNKMDEENVRKYELFETDHRDLDKVAFESFSGRCQRIVWGKDELCQRVNQEFYEQYICIGILVQEEGVDIVNDPGTPIAEHVQYKTEVRFYHKLFCEWYAAHYIADYIQHNPTLDLRKFLQQLDPSDVQYIYRFACGLNPTLAGKIIEYLKGLEGGDKFAILCILEQTGKIDNIKETIRQLCFEGVVISGHDSLLLQRSSLQLIEIAAKNDIPIKAVQLHNCFQSVDLSTTTISITSGLKLNAKIPFKELNVDLYDREMTEDEVIAILEFSSMCPSLEILEFGGSVPPQSFEVDSTLATLNVRNVKVSWQLFNGYPMYILNLWTGRWQKENSERELTEEEVEMMRLRFNEYIENRTEEFYKEDVKEIRDKLRKMAEERQNSKPNEGTDVGTDIAIK